jgi:hypothetical protein
VLMWTVRLTQPDSPPMVICISLHTKQGKRRKGKANMTHMVGCEKPALLSINC